MTRRDQYLQSDSAIGDKPGIYGSLGRLSERENFGVIHTMVNFGDLLPRGWCESRDARVLSSNEEISAGEVSA
jgi:hypothetical protein